MQVISLDRERSKRPATCPHDHVTGRTDTDNAGFFSTGACEVCGAAWDTRRGEAPFWKIEAGRRA